MFPIRDTMPSRKPPIAMWTIVAINVLVFLIQVRMPENHLKNAMFLFGVVPARFTHPGWAADVGFPLGAYWPFLTSLFLHGGWFHIIANMWTLWIFGDNVEDTLGHVRFVVFYLVCGVASGIVHTVANPASTVPAIGASGAIAGVLAAYLFLFPLARVLCMVPIFIFPFFFRVPAFLFILLWFFTQFFSGWSSLLEPQHGGGVAFWAHIGGFISGILLLPVFRPDKKIQSADDHPIEEAGRHR